MPDVLPELPKTRKKREADLTPRVLQWFRENHSPSCAIEIKATYGLRLAARVLQPHQKAALLDAASGRGIVHKLSDEARRQQPFDAFKLASVPAYVVACFTRNRTCHIVPVARWVGISITSQEFKTFKV